MRLEERHLETAAKNLLRLSPSCRSPRLEYTQGCVATRLPCSLLGHVFWPINKLNYHSHAAPGWWGLDVSNLIDVVLDEADLEKDKKRNPSLLLLGLINMLTLATLATWSFEAACSVRPRHQKNLKAIPSSLWLLQQQEGTSSRLRDRACSRVGKQLPQGLKPPKGGKRLTFSGLQMLHRTDAWTDAPSVEPSTATYAIYLQTQLSHTKCMFALSCYVRYLLSASTALYELLNLPDSLRNAPEPTAASCSETSSLHHHHPWTMSPAITQHICHLTTSAYKYTTSALLLSGGAWPGSSCTITSSYCRTARLRLFVLTSLLPKPAISNAPCSRIKDDK